MPVHGFVDSARVLDYRRLGKQNVSHNSSVQTAWRRNIKPVNVTSTTLLFCCSLGVNASGVLQPEMKIYADANGKFWYSADRYSHIDKADNLQDGSYSYYLRIKEVEAEDIVTVCNGSLRKCANNNGDKPYWYSEDGTLTLFSATTSVRKRAGRAGETLYEAFPACPATDSEGSSAYVAIAMNLSLPQEARRSL